MASRRSDSGKAPTRGAAQKGGGETASAPAGTCLARLSIDGPDPFRPRPGSPHCPAMNQIWLWRLVNGHADPYPAPLRILATFHREKEPTYKDILSLEEALVSTELIARGTVVEFVVDHQAPEEGAGEAIELEIVRPFPKARRTDA